jgi:hypothetical protein
LFVLSLLAWREALKGGSGFGAVWPASFAHLRRTFRFFLDHMFSKRDEFLYDALCFSNFRKHFIDRGPEIGASSSFSIASFGGIGMKFTADVADLRP